ncbi:YheC/YheD family protein [Desmospora profundinema]|uniref:Glycosyltransferase involved in cell wall biosynthesis n=1 Tax=Desmospora profundinema TaxID=1571184 RepID=A0ABU1IHP0_9BACL|nr:YheC/YheD family protein [Desmospora profundinema]MDR6224292.1 glycosyltransferase involved in cell wall biosynthesis [Desmospora profundinema]
MSNFDVGVMISRRVFGDCLRETSPYESLALYDEGGRKEGFSPVFFTIDQIRFADWTVNGVIRDGTGCFRWKRVPLPRLIHNRIKPMIHTPALTRLQRWPGTTLFNGENRLDKWRVDRILRKNPDLAQRLPETALASQEEMIRLLDTYGSVYVKPRDRSLGLGILRVDRVGKTGKVKVVEANGSRGEIGSLSSFCKIFRVVGKRPFYLIQQAIPLVEEDGCPVDLRVTVQRDGTGEWQVSGMVAKKGLRYGIVTNVAAGGVAVKIDPVLKTAFPDSERREQVRKHVVETAVAAARQLSRKVPYLADLGMDIGVDREGNVWIIEVNGRDLRITFRHAKELEIWRDTFHKPMQYAAYLLNHTKRAAGSDTAFLTPGSLRMKGKRSGSVETAVRHLAEALSKNDTVYVIGKGVADLGEAMGIEVRSPNTRGYLEGALGELKRLSPRWVQVENRPTFVPHVKRICPDAKVVLSLHSDRYLMPPHLETKKRARFLSICDGVLTNSQFLKNRLLRWVPELEGRVKTLPLGVDLKRFLPREDPLSMERRKRMRKRWGIRESDRLLLFVGRWIPQKGIHHLLKALPKIIQHESNIRLVIVGGSHYGKNLETHYVRYVKKLAKPLGDIVSWMPFIPHMDIPKCYAAADLLVVPSTGSEAFGLVNLEGMASSLPVVSVRTGGIPEVVEDGKTGILVDPAPQHLPKALADACSRLLSDPDKMKDMGKNGQKRAEQFGWSHVAEQWVRLRSDWEKTRFHVQLSDLGVKRFC